MQDKIKKELCFRRDEKFGSNHVCRNNYMLLITEEDIIRYDNIY